MKKMTKAELERDNAELRARCAMLEEVVKRLTTAPPAPVYVPVPTPAPAPAPVTVYPPYIVPQPTAYPWWQIPVTVYGTTCANPTLLQGDVAITWCVGNGNLS